jgi:hypothetical protein
MRNCANRCRWMVALLAAALPALCLGQEPAGERHKTEIMAGIAKAQDYLGRFRLQDVRSTLELLNHKLGQFGSELGSDAAALRAKTDAIAARASATEDSLVKVPVSILYARGPDSALAYLQNDLRRFGVSEKKVELLEKKILAEGPKVRRELDRQAIDRTIKTLNSGQTPPPTLDPYILTAAKRAIKAHSDSIAAAEDEKKRKIETDKKRQEMLHQQQLDKEKKAAEDKAARLRQEQEKKRSAEAEIVRRKAEAVQKARQDSIATVRRDSTARAVKAQQQIAAQEKERQRKLDEQQREKARLAKAKEDSVKQAAALREKARSDGLAAIRRDSLAAVQKVQQERAEQEKQRQHAALDEQKKRELAALTEENRRKQQQQATDDSLAALQKAQLQQEKVHLDKKASADKAQAMTVDLYNMLDKKQAKKALEKFEQNQGFLVAAMEPEAYVTLDHALVCGTIMALTEPLAAGKRNRQTAQSPQRQALDQIYDLMKDDKIEAAYAQFRFAERSLADFMAKGEFPLLKSLMEGAYEDRKKVMRVQPGQ